MSSKSEQQGEEHKTELVDHAIPECKSCKARKDRKKNKTVVGSRYCQHNCEDECAIIVAVLPSGTFQFECGCIGYHNNSCFFFKEFIDWQY